MNTTMTNQSKQRVEEALNEMLTDARCAAINDCVNAINEQWKQYDRLLESKEARVIWENTYGEKFQALYNKRSNLRSKQELIMNIMGKVYDLKWEEQEEK